MTVNELISALEALAREGKGQLKVMLRNRPYYEPVTSVEVMTEVTSSYEPVVCIE